MDFDNGKEQVTRRQMIRVLAAFGITGPAALELAAKAQDRLSPETLEAATALLDQDFDEEKDRSCGRSAPEQPRPVSDRA